MTADKTGSALILQLQKFIQAYYRNQMRKGAMITVMVAACSFTLLCVAEYFGYFPSWVRAILLYSFILAALGIGIVYVGVPYMRKRGILKGISYSEAAVMIGNHFSEIGDKLLNAVQLQQQVGTCPKANMDLLMAGIEQRTVEMNRFHFPLAINVKNTRKYAQYALLAMLIIGGVLIFDNQLFTLPTHRIIHYTRYFEKPAPYQLVVQNRHLQAFANDNYTLHVKAEGEEIPDEVYINIDGVEYGMQPSGNGEYSYEFRNVQQDVDFYIFTHEVHSRNYTLQVLAKPVLISFSMDMEYPAYVGKPNETVENAGDISVPEGTKITWKINSRNADIIYFRHNVTTDTLEPDGDKTTCSLRVFTGVDYAISSANEYMQHCDSLHYHVDVVPDRYPLISVTAINDTAYIDRFYFKGTVEDDYGFTALKFVYTIEENAEKIKTEKVNLPLQDRQALQDFYYYFDGKTLQLTPGQSVSYYFEIYDNDAINGAKCTRSTAMEFHLPSVNEIVRQMAQGNEHTQKSIEKIMKEGEKVLKEIADLQKKMVDKKNPDWQDKKQMEDLIKQLQDIKREGEQVVEEQKRQEHISEQYQTMNEELIEKQKELQRRFDELFNDDMKNTLNELQQLMNRNMDQNRMNQMMENIKVNTEELNKQLDQNLELFKQLEVDAKLENAISQAEEIAKQEQGLSEKTADKAADMNAVQQEQQRINEQFRQLQQEYTAMQKLNNELDDPYAMQKVEQAMQEAAQAMEEAQNATDKGSRQQAAEKQQRAAEKMQALAQAMESMMEEDENEDTSEDIATIRQILDNIVRTSFTQESIMKRMDVISPQDPSMRTLIQEQYQLKNQLKLITDSVNAVARRQIAVEPFITKQVGIINESQTDVLNMLSLTQEPSMRYYYNNNTRHIVAKQQFMMTSLNDLALMLAESMKKMEEKQQQQGSGKGKGNCNSESCQGGKKSKQGKSAKSMRQMQEKLNEQLQEMRKQLQQGQQQGAKPGEKGSPSMSEQFARMAAQQEAIRRMMQQYQSDLKKEGKGYDAGINKLLQQMEQTERDLVNKTITGQTIQRQQQILTRMLESERAEMQREKEEQRQSRQAVNAPVSTPPPYIEQQLNKNKETELYHTVPPALNSYYRNKVNTYFNQFNAQ